MMAHEQATWLGPARIGMLVDECFAAHARLEGAVAVPHIRDRVRVDGHEEVFFVVYVDARRRVADVVCGERVGFLSDIPFKAIHPAPDPSAG